MKAALHQHYLEIWKLASSLEKGWWNIQEKKAIEQALKDLSDLDPNLYQLNLQDPNFTNQLLLRLQAFVLASPDLPSPKRNVIENPQKQQYLKELEEREEKIPFLFRNPQGKMLRKIPPSEVFLILKKHGLTNKEGNFDLSNEAAVAAAQEDLGLRIGYYYHFEQLKEKIVQGLAENCIPVGLFWKETFGKTFDNQRVPGLVEQAASKIAEKALEELRTRLKSKLGGQPISISSPGFFMALSRAATELRTAAIARKFVDPRETEEVVTTFLSQSPKFNLLEPSAQKTIVRRLTQVIVGVGTNPKLIPRTIDDVFIRTKKEDVSLKLTPVTAGAKPGRESNFCSFPALSKNIRQRIKKEINKPEIVLATKGVQNFIESFARDPVSALLHYPLYSLVGLLPQPAANLYFQKTGWQETFKTVRLAYGVSVSPDLQRQFLQDILWRGGKLALRSFGIVNEKGQWLWISALGVATDKMVTGIGEGTARILSKLPMVGRGLGNIFSKNIGKKRRRDKNLGAAILGLIFNLGLTIFGLIPKASWWLLNKIPAVQRFKIWIEKKWVGFRFALESRFPILKYIRLGTNVIGSLIRALPHGLATAGLSYLASSGNLPLSIALGSVDLFWNTLRNLGRASEFFQWAVGSHQTLLGRFLGWGISSHRAYLPIKGPLLTWFLTDTLLPIFGINFPFGLKLFGSFLAGGLEYIYFAGVRPFLSARVPLFIAEKITGPLGKFFGGVGLGLPGGLIFPQLLVALGANPIISYLLGIPAGIAGWWTLMRFVFPALVPYSFFGWLGMIGGELLALKLGLGGIWSPFFQAGGYLLGCWLAKIGISAFMSWFVSWAGSWITTNVAAGLNAALAGGAALTTGLSASAVLATIGSIVLAAGVTMLVIATIAGAFFQLEQLKEAFAPPESECFAPQKTVQIFEENDVARTNPKKEADANDLLVYTIKLNPKKTKIENVIVKDKILEESCSYEPLPAFRPLVDRDSFKVLSIDPDSIQKGPFTRAGQSANPVCFDTWFEVHWTIPVVTSANDQIVYQIKVDKDYQTGAIANQLIVDGTSIETTTTTVTDPYTGSSSTQTSKKKAECKVQLFNYVNRGTAEAAELTETIINRLNKGCGINKVSKTNLTNTKNCLKSYGIPEVAITHIEESVTNPNFNGMLQCVGFVKAIEAATGGTIQNLSFESAKDYWTSLPGYQKISKANYNNIQKGDILIWTGPYPDGHMAIVIEPVLSSGKLVKIIVGEAIGDTGLVRIRQLPVTEFGIDSPGLIGWQRRSL